MIAFRTTSFLLSALTLFGTSGAFALDRTLDVVGWTAVQDLFRLDRPDDSLGNDPVVGRQACPSLLRYNSINMKPEAVLLKSVPDDGDKWNFVLRPSIRWWSGTNVSPAELAASLEKDLKDALVDRQIDASPRISVQGATVEVQWPKNPPFGPMILAGRPLWRQVNGKSPAFECAGLYTISNMDAGAKNLTMSLSKGYSGKFQTIKILSAQPNEKSPTTIAFTSEAVVSPTSTVIPSRKCDGLLDIPFATAIIWNPDSRWASTPGMRQALTQATPRGEILRTAAADLGSLISGPILRNHPGYTSQQIVPPFNLEVANTLLSAAGLKQSAIGAPRSASDGTIMHLRFLRANKVKQGLIEKIISDSYASLGIETEFVENTPANIAQVDGVLAGVALPWPELNLKEFLHSRGQKKLSAFPFFVPNDKSLDEALDAYEQSLLAGKPRLDQLSRVHSRFADLESWSMIMGHQSCVKTAGIPLRSKLNIADPDWFRKLVVD